MKTIVAYHLHNEDFTAELVRKAGLFWIVQDADGNEIKIPAKAVEETWEESDEPLLGADDEPGSDVLETGVEVDDEQDNPTVDGFLPAAPSLADQALTGPVIEEPSLVITLAELCDTYGVEPRIARRQLRNAVKAGQWEHDPRTGWVFRREDIDAVMLLITTKKRG